MSDKFSDHDIENFYKQGAKEQPSTELDLQIFQLAQQNLVNTKGKTDNVTAIKIVSSKKTPLYQTWYGQLSTAASLVLVAVLFLQNSEPSYNSISSRDQQIKPRSEQSGSIDNDKIQNVQQNHQLKISPSLKSQINKAIAVKQAQGGHKKEQTRHSNATAVEKVEMQSEDFPKDFQQSPLSMESNVQAIAVSQLNEITEMFTKIDALLDNGETIKAAEVLTQLLQKYPQLKTNLKTRYNKLVIQAIK